MSDTATKERCIGVLAAQVPETMRLMNAHAVCVEAELGTDPDEDEVDAIPEETVDRYEEALGELAQGDDVDEIETFGMRAFHLTAEKFNALKAAR